MIDKENFLQIINLTPLVSIDLILEDQQQKFLLGKRNNRPAKGYWFVPGGIIRKNEKISEAIKRISSAELGTAFSITNATLFGVYEHLYEDNFSGAQGISTHYVVLAYKIKVVKNFKIQPDSQHLKMKWWSKNNLLNEPEVHQYTKNYFI